MREMVDIDVVIDEKYDDPKVTIQTREHTRQVKNIIEAIENVSHSDYPPISCYSGKKMVLLSQRDIMRAYIDGRKVILETQEGEYTPGKPLSKVEEQLNTDRFIRISQSEIINIYKVNHFDISVSGTIGVEFENGVRTWASRSRVKHIKAMLTKRIGG